MKPTLESRFRPNLPHVTSERFDDEVVIVDFASGRYHSLEGAAVGIWQLVERGLTVREIIRDVETRHEPSASDIDDGVLEFLDRLLAEQLIVPAEGQPGGAPGDTSAPSTSDPGPRPSFSPPILTTFSDMADLLVLDPIHEVDDAGWPMPRARDES